MDFPHLNELSGWTLGMALAVGVISVARTARLIVHDDFPPIAWLRVRFVALFPGDSSWSKLVECQFCLAPYLTIGMMAWAWLSNLHWTWWVINGWWACSYVAAILVAYDEGAA